MRTTLGSYLGDYISRGGDTAFVHRRGLRAIRTSYGEIARSAYRFARELDSLGVAKGDRVLLRAENSADWVVVFFGCVIRGAIFVPLDLHSAPEFASRVARQVEPKLAVVDSAEASEALSCPLLRTEELGPRLARHSGAPAVFPEIDPDDTVELVFTSGTTAEPKGVRITHRNMLANLVPLEREIGRYLKYERFVHPLRFLSLVPLSHVFGQIMGLFAPQMLGGEVHFHEAAGPSRIIEIIRRDRISVLVAVPRMLDSLRETITRDYEARDGSGKLGRALEAAHGRHPMLRWWRFRSIHARFGWKFWAFISGGATLARDTEEFWDTLGFAVIQGYGMTETASLISVNHPFKTARGSVGRVMPGQTVKLAPDGEILVRGENVSPGRWNETAGAPEAVDGWLHTGDMGEMDAAGNLYFKGRKKDVIVTAAGMNVHPGDIEQVLDRQPEIRASAVVAGKGPDGPEPVAALIPRSSDADMRAAVERANGSLAPHQRIRRWFIWPGDDFPRTPTQKVRKQIIAGRALAAIGGDAVRGDAAAPGAVGEIVSRMSGGMPALSASSALGMDLKLDSLGRVELLGAIEDRYQIELDEAVLTETTTLGELEKLVREQGGGAAVQYPYPRWQLRPPVSWLRIALFNLLAMTAVRILGKPRIFGRERLKGLDGPVVVVCNHITVADAGLVLYALPRSLRARTAIAMDGEILRTKRNPPAEKGPIGRLFEMFQYGLVVFFFNVFSMPRKSGFRRSFLFAGELMDRGYSLLVFPEGRYTTDGTIGPFLPGTGLLVSRLGAPVVPVRLDGLWELKAAGRRIAKAGDILVHIGNIARYAPHDSPERISGDLLERVKRA